MLSLLSGYVLQGIARLQGTADSGNIPEVDPLFPPEIEEIIFDYALQQHLASAPDRLPIFILTSKRIYNWLIPKLFEVVIVTRSRHFPLKQFTRAQAKRYGMHVRHLHASKEAIGRVLGTYTSETRIYEGLAVFPNLIDIRLSWEPVICPIPALQTMPLTHLTIYLKEIVMFLELAARGPQYWTDTKKPSSSRQLPAFPTVTHLHCLSILWSAYSQPHLDALAHHFPNVTHFACEILLTMDAQMAKLLLENCTKMEVFVGLRPGPLATNKSFELPTNEVEDKRIVLLTADSESDWEVRARGNGVDMWSFADAVVKSR